MCIFDINLDYVYDTVSELVYFSVEKEMDMTLELYSMTLLTFFLCTKYQTLKKFSFFTEKLLLGKQREGPSWGVFHIRPEM